MVLEKVASRVLLGVLDKYAEGVDPKQLQLSLWKGEGVIQNLVLKTSAVELDLPISITRAICKKVTFTFPWNALQSQPCIASVEELLVCGIAANELPFNAGAANEQRQRSKMTLVEQYEAERKAKAKDKEPEMEAGYISHLTEIVLHNMIFEIHKVHVRLEAPSKNVIVGITLGNLRLTSCTESGSHTFVEPSKVKCTHKQLAFDDLSIYCAATIDSVSTFCSNITSPTQWETAMLVQLEKNWKQGKLPIILGPVSGNATLSLVFKKFIKQLLEVPYVKFVGSVDNVTSTLSRGQYVSILTVAALFANWTTLSRFMQYRPFQTPVHGNARIWWRYAFRCIIDVIRDRRRIFAPPDEIVSHRTQMYEQIFYKTILHQEDSLKDEERRKYLVLQKLLSANQMFAARRHVYAEVAEDLQMLRARKEQLKKEKEKEGGGWWGWFGAKSDESAKIDSQEALLQEVEKSYGIEPGEDTEKNQPASAELPLKYCWLDVSLSVTKLGVTADFASVGVSATSFASCSGELRNIAVQFKKFNRAGTTAFGFSASDLTVSNPQPQSRDTVPMLVRRAVPMNEDLQPLVCIQGDVKPIEPKVQGTNTDLELSVCIQPLIIVASALSVRIAQKFFAVPEAVNIEPVTKPTKNLASAVTRAASQHIASTIYGAKSVHFVLDVQAPIVVLPKSLGTPPEDTPALGVSLGKLTFRSCPLTDDERKRRIEAADSADPELLYYHNEAHLSDLFVTSTNCSEAFRDIRNGFTVLPEVAADALVLTKMIATDTAHEALVLKCKINSAIANISLYHAHGISMIMDEWRQSSSEGPKYTTSHIEFTSSNDTVSPIHPKPPSTAYVESTVEDVPQWKMCLSVGTFGFNIVDDNEGHLLTTPHFVFMSEGITSTLLSRTISTRISASMMQLRCISQIADASKLYQILTCGSRGKLDEGCVGFIMQSTVGEPTSIEVAISQIKLDYGTPFMELVESIMDVANILKSAPSESDTAVLPQNVPAQVTDKSVTADDNVTTILALSIEEAAVHFLERNVGMSEDYGYLDAKMSGATVKLTLRQETLDVIGTVSEVDLVLCEAQNERVKQLLSRGKADARTKTKLLPIVSFRFCTARPSYVRFDHPKFTLRDCNFTNFLTVEVQPAALTYSAAHIMTLLQYFTSGFTSRLTALSRRKRYDGREVKSKAVTPPVLTSMKIVINQPSVLLPSNPFVPSCAMLEGSLDKLEITNRIDVKTEGVVIDMVLSKLEIAIPSLPSIVKSSVSKGSSSLSSKRLALQFHNNLNAAKLVRMRIGVTSDDLNLSVTHGAFLRLLETIASNILNMPPIPDTANPGEAPKDTPKAQGNICNMHFGGLRFVASDNSDLKVFQFAMIEPAIVFDNNPEQVQTTTSIAWKSILVEDATASSTLTSTLMQCDRAAIKYSMLRQIDSCDIDFIMKRCAVSPKWKTIYDYVLSADTFDALAPMFAPKPELTPKAKQQPKPLRVRIQVSEFIAPLMSTSGDEIYTMTMSSLGMELNQTPPSPTAVADVGSFSMGCKLHSVSLSSSATKTKLVSCRESAAALLNISMQSKKRKVGDTVEANSNVDVTLTGLDAVLAMPELYRLIDFAANPNETISLLMTIGAKEDPSSGARSPGDSPRRGGSLKTNVSWENPTIFIVEDARDGEDISQGWYCNLGKLTAEITNDNAAGTLSVQSELRDTTIDGLLSKASFTYDSRSSVTENVSNISFGETVFTLSHSSLSKLVNTLYFNLMLPSPMKSKAGVVDSSAQISRNAPEKPKSQMNVLLPTFQVLLFDRHQWHFATYIFAGLKLTREADRLTVEMKEMHGTDPASGGSLLSCGSPSDAALNVTMEKGKTNVRFANASFILVVPLLGPTVDLALAPLSQHTQASVSAAKDDNEDTSSAKDETEVCVELQGAAFELHSQEGVSLCLLTASHSSMRQLSHSDGSSSLHLEVGEVALMEQFTKTQSPEFPFVAKSLRLPEKTEQVFLVIDVVNHPPPTEKMLGDAFFAKDISVKMSSFQVVYIPSIASVLGAALADVSKSTANLEKAKARVGEEAAVIANEYEALRRVRVEMQRPEIVVATSNKVKDCIRFFPGTLVFETEMTTFDGSLAEQYEVSIAHIEVTVLDEPAFWHKTSLKAVARFALQQAKASFDNTFEVYIPLISSSLSRPQALFLYLLAGDMMVGNATKTSPAQLPAPAEVPMLEKQPTTSAPVESPTASPRSSKISINWDALDMRLCEVFSLQLKSLSAIVEQRKAGNSLNLDVASFGLRHLDDNVLSCERVTLKRSAPNEHDAETPDTLTTEMDISAQQFDVGLSPSAVVSFTSELYTPICVHILRAAVAPKATLTLTSPITELSEPLPLTPMHFLLVRREPLASYELDLNGQTLSLTAPGACIVLDSCCSLTLTNGTVLVAGVYSLPSFVSYGTGSSLSIGHGCSVTREMFKSVKVVKSSNPREHVALRHHIKANFQSSLAIRDQPNGSFGVSFGCFVQFLDTSVDGTTVKRFLNVKLDDLRTTDSNLLLPTNAEAVSFGEGAMSFNVFIKSLELRLPLRRLIWMTDAIQRISDAWTAGWQTPRPTSVAYDTACQRLSERDRSMCYQCGRRAALMVDKFKVCSACATGRRSLALPSVELTLPLSDVLLVGTCGEQVELMLNETVACIDHQHNVKFRTRGSLAVHNISSAAWEPTVERLSLTVDGSRREGTYEIKSAELFLVLSPFAVATLQALAQQYSSPPPLHPSRHVFVSNLMMHPMVVDEKTILPGREISFEVHGRSDLNLRLDEAVESIIPMDVTAYHQFGPNLCEVNARPLASTISLMHVHSSAGMILIQSSVEIALKFEGIEPILTPHGTTSLPPSFHLKNPFLITPVEDPSDEYSASDSGSAVIPTFYDVLNGRMFQIRCASKTRKNVALWFTMASQNAGMSLGVPKFVIHIGGSRRLENALPGRLMIVVATSNGHVLKNAKLGVGEHLQVFQASSLSDLQWKLCYVEGRTTYETSLFSFSQQDEVIRLNALGGRKYIQLTSEVQPRAGCITLCVPFSVLNHTQLPLEMHIDENTRIEEARMNYCVLLPESDQPVCVLPPRSAGEKECFAHLTHNSMRTLAPIPLHTTSAVGEIELWNESQTEAIHLCYRTQMGSEGVRGRVVTITPKWIVVNRTPSSLYIAQDLGTKCISFIQISSGSAMHLYYMIKPEDGVGWRLAVGRDSRIEPGNGFRIDEVCQAMAVVRDLENPSNDFSLRVTVLQADSYVYVTLDPTPAAPFVIVNRTAEEITVVHRQREDRDKQHKANSSPFIVPPFALRECHLDVYSVRTVINYLTVTLIGVNFNIDFERTTNGYVPESRQSFEIKYKVSRGELGQTVVTIAPCERGGGAAIQYTSPPKPPLDIKLFLRTTALSLVIPNMEVLFFVMSDVNFSYQRAGRNEVAKVECAEYQIDNQTEEDPAYPVTLFPLHKPKIPPLSAMINREIVDGKQFVHLSEIKIDVAPVVVRCSDLQLLAIANFMSILRDSTHILKGRSQTVFGAGGSSAAALPTITPFTMKAAKQMASEAPMAGGIMAFNLVIDRLVINPTAIRFWFKRETEKADVLKDRASEWLSLAVFSCEDVGIMADGLTQANVDTTVQIWVNQLTNFYQQSLIKQLKAVIFQYFQSMPLLGAPVKLVSQVGTGAVKFFQEPIEGLIESPEAFALGVARGTSTLVGNVIGGSLGVVSNVASVGKRIADVAGGNEAQKSKGGIQVFKGLARGITGLVTQPIKGVAEGGAAGLMKGIGQGVVGVVAQPVGGLLGDVATVTGAAAAILSNTAIPRIQRMRPPRKFLAGGGVAAYKSVVEVYQYNRRFEQVWTAMLLPTDGPSWSCDGHKKTKVDAERDNNLSPPVDWRIDKHGKTYEGYEFASEYYGVYHRRPSEETLLRRRRWVAVVEPRQSSRVVQSEARLTFSDLGRAEDAFGDSLVSSVLFNESLARSATPPEESIRVVETFENQRYFPFFGWGKKMLPTDRSAWSARHDSRPLPKESFVLAEGWVWADEWTPTGGDKDHWEYALDFPRSFSPINGATDCVRRRCWRRTMRKVQ